MKMVPVKSSNVESVGHDANAQMLDIKFIGGDTYRYYGVPNIVHHNLMTSDSIGKFIAANLKGRYTSEKL